MENLLNSFISFSLSQLLICLILLLRQFRGRSFSEAFFAALLLADAAYLVSPWIESGWLQHITSIAQTCIPSLFWLFCLSLFDDHFRLRPWQLGLAAIPVVLPALGALQSTGSFWLNQLFFTLPQGLEFVILFFALAAVVRNWSNDLLEYRRNLRVWFSGFIGLYILLLIAAQQILFRGEQWLHIWQYLPAGAILLLSNIVLLEFNRSVFAPPLPLPKPSEAEAEIEHPLPQHQPEPEVEEVPEGILLAIRLLMDEEHIYREMGLTIGQLADKLDIQEYRLRKIINAGMGYRNFNDFLNTYRIREACLRLKQEPDTAVLNIALDIGFRSLSSFNKAFKDSQEMTPTAYRHQFK